MQATITATSSMLDAQTIRIETVVTMGEQSSSKVEHYDVDYIMESRLLKGPLEDRIEQLRVASCTVTERAIHEHLIKINKAPEPEITEVPARCLMLVPGAPEQEPKAEKPKRQRKAPAKKTQKESK